MFTSFLEKYVIYKNHYDNNVLEFRDDFNESLDNYIELLKTVKIVKFGSNFNQNINIIPENVEFIILMNPNYNYPVSSFQPNPLAPTINKKIYFKSTNIDEWTNLVNILIKAHVDIESIGDAMDARIFEFKHTITSLESMDVDANDDANAANDAANYDSDDNIGYNKSNGMYYSFL